MLGVVMKLQLFLTRAEKFLQIVQSMRLLLALLRYRVLDLGHGPIN